MSEEREALAIARIERACARIEAALRPVPSPAESGELERIAARHATLRARVEHAIGDIDLMLGEKAG